MLARPRSQASQDKQPLRHSGMAQIIQTDEPIHPQRPHQDRHHQGLFSGEGSKKRRALDNGGEHNFIHTFKIPKTRFNPQYAA